MDGDLVLQAPQDPSHAYTRPAYRIVPLQRQDSWNELRKVAANVFRPVAKLLPLQRGPQPPSPSRVAPWRPGLNHGSIDGRGEELAEEPVPELEEAEYDDDSAAEKKHCEDEAEAAWCGCVYVGCMFEVAYKLHACCMRAACVLPKWCVRVTVMLHVCRMYAACMPHACRVYVAGMYAVCMSHVCRMYAACMPVE